MGIKEGLSSDIFAVSFVFSSIIIYDAKKLRKVVELHSKALNFVFDKLKSDQLANNETGDRVYDFRFPEMVGHSIGEILAGIVVGVGGSLLVFKVVIL